MVASPKCVNENLMFSSAKVAAGYSPHDGYITLTIDRASRIRMVHIKTEDARMLVQQINRILDNETSLNSNSS